MQQPEASRQQNTDLSLSTLELRPDRPDGRQRPLTLTRVVVATASETPATPQHVGREIAIQKCATSMITTRMSDFRCIAEMVSTYRR